MTKRLSTTLLAMLVMGMVSAPMAVTAQTTTTTKKTTRRPATHRKTAAEEKQEALEQELNALKQQLSAQQSEIENLRSQNSTKDEQVTTATQQAQQAAQAAQAAQSEAQSASSSAQQSSSAVTDLKTEVNAIQTTNAGLAQTISDTKTQLNAKIDAPSALHYKGVTITPVGFFAAESVYRTRALDSDINTPFNSTPYMNAGQAYTSEFNGSGRQSRLGLRVVANAPWGKATGYVETDFLGAGITSNNNQSNSYVLRMRQFWGQVALNNGFTFTGGQMWSLVTETKHAVDPSTENLPQEIDAQYHVGFSWMRQYGLRAAQSFAHGKVTAAVSIEEPQLVGYNSNTTPPDFFVGAVGTGGGLYNLSNKYSTSAIPDMVGKVALDPGYGHYEFGLIGRFFRSRIYPTQTSNASATTLSGQNDTEGGGGGFVNLRFPVTKYLDVGAHFMGGDGINRYGTSQLPEVTVHPNGELEPLRGYQGLFSLEAHPSKKLDIVGYAGSEYAQRTYYISGSTIYGYAPPSINTSSCFAEQDTVAPSTGSAAGVFGGAPYDPSSSCGAQTRVITEGTVGFVYKFFNGPQLGRFQYWMTYNYLTKTAWVGTAGAPHATNNMIFTSFRYYIP